MWEVTLFHTTTWLPTFGSTKLLTYQSWVKWGTRLVREAFSVVLSSPFNMKKPFRDDQLASTLMSLAVASLAVTSCHSSSSASAAASSKGCWQWLPAFVPTKMKLVGHEILWPTKVWQVKKKKQYYHRIPLRSSHVGLRRKYTLYLWNGCDDCFRLLLSYTRNTTRLKTSSANWANLMIKKKKKHDKSNQGRDVCSGRREESVTWNPPETTLPSVPCHNKEQGRTGSARQMIV